MKSVLAFILLSAVVAAPALAAKKPAATTWTQEPDSFMGLRFDQKVDVALPACPRGVGIHKQMCHEPPYTNLYTVNGGPSVGFGYSLSVFAGGSGVESFYLSTNSDNFSQLAELFTTKYGTPQSSTSEVVKTKGGASFTNETLSWRGSKVSITLQKFAGDINTSAATISDIAATLKKAEEREAKTNSAASKL
ncbi:hypothetical protein [Pseudomonas fluorescens]|uniref:hypothetical protein n=1 Tax=Pseudomonas fluorescens TaxID=294 RepID=UPI000F48729E|nr:hypothetical protein [Pseudomonas fluorescens]RON88458.1 hypothetical protein BK668_16015 [Pseudomonas fluorescens]